MVYFDKKYHQESSFFPADPRFVFGRSFTGDFFEIMIEIGTGHKTRFPGKNIHRDGRLLINEFFRVFDSQGNPPGSEIRRHAQAEILPEKIQIRSQSRNHVLNGVVLKVTLVFHLGIQPALQNRSLFFIQDILAGRHPHLVSAI